VRIAHDTVGRCHDGGVAEIDLGLVERGGLGGDHGGGLAALGLQHVDMRARRSERRAVAREHRLLLRDIGLGLLLALGRGCAGAREIVVARQFLLREGDARLVGIDGGLGLRDGRLLLVQLRIEVGGGRLGVLEIGGGTFGGGLVVARIDARHHIALMDDLVVGHVQLGHIAADLGRDGDAVGAQISVVGCLVVTSDQIPIDAVAETRGQHDRAQRAQQEATTTAVVRLPLGGRRFQRGFVFNLVELEGGS